MKRTDELGLRIKSPRCTSDSRIYVGLHTVVRLPLKIERIAAGGKPVVHRCRRAAGLILKVDLIVAVSRHCLLTPICGILPHTPAIAIIIILAATTTIEVKEIHVIARHRRAIDLHKLPITVERLVVERIIPSIRRRRRPTAVDITTG